MFGWIRATQILIHICQLFLLKYRYKFRVLIIKSLSKINPAFELPLNRANATLSKIFY